MQLHGWLGGCVLFRSSPCNGGGNEIGHVDGWHEDHALQVVDHGGHLLGTHSDMPGCRSEQELLGEGDLSFLQWQPLIVLLKGNTVVLI